MTRRHRIAAVVAIVTLVAIDVAGGHAHPEDWWHGMPAFDLLYGFAGCVAVVIAAKILGSAWLQRGQGYYEGEP